MSLKGEIQGTPLMDDIQSVLQVSDRSRVLQLTATIHTEKEDFDPMKVLFLSNVRDYLKLTGEYFQLTVMIAMGDYLYRVLPFRENLEISITTSWHYEYGKEDENQPPRQIRYKALLNTTQNPFPSSETFTNRANQDINLLPPLEIVFELVDRREELLRVKQIDGTFQNVTTEQMLRGEFTHEANKIKVDGKGIIQVVEMDKPDNDRVYPNLLIPSGQLLRNLPGYLQEKAKGVYSQGLGCFFQSFKNQPTWFVYPLYKINRFDEDRYKMVIYAVPEERYPTHNHSYRMEGKILYIVTTGEKKAVDLSRNNDLNTGVGFRMTNAESMMRKPVEISESGIKANRHRLNYEVLQHNRKDQVAFTPTVKASANPFLEYSRLNASEFAGMTVSWENSDPDLIYPGMPVKYVFMDKGQYTERKGTLVKAISNTMIQGNPTVDTVHKCSTQLFFFIEPLNYQPDNDPEAYVGEDKMLL